MKLKKEKKKKNIRTGDLKLGEWVADRVVVLVCTYLQLQVVLSYSYTYNIIFIT